MTDDLRKYFRDFDKDLRKESKASDESEQLKDSKESEQSRDPFEDQPKGFQLNEDQANALKLLQSGDNVFLTGSAGTGKSFVITKYMMSLRKDKQTPLLATTGAAAVIIGGRTFHSFFGLGIMEGGLTRTVERALDNPRVSKRIKKTREVIIDEISMLHPAAFEAAHQIAQKIRGNLSPFGGLRLIVIGDFFQLPPVDRFEARPPWIFKSPLWDLMNFKVIELKKSMRTENEDFVKILNKIRFGICDKEVTEFLENRRATLTEAFNGTVLFGRKQQAESYNQLRLGILKGEVSAFPTECLISSHCSTPSERLIAQSPLPAFLFLKKEALVMIRKNDIEGQYVNGSLGFLKKIKPESLEIELLNKRKVTLIKEDFNILDGEGKTLAVIRNFPLNLGWATTIHKAQGASLDCLHVNLKGLWEYGHTYVAMSRARDPQQLFIEDWDPRSIRVDPEVMNLKWISKPIHK